MKKILSYIICCIEILSILFFAGCQRTYPFQQDQSEIVSVQIVSIKYVETKECLPEEVLICDIENISDFLSDFSELEVDPINPPNRAECFQTPTAIKIAYQDGEFEWIAPVGTMIYRPDGFNNFYGVNTFDEQEFATLIEKYVGNSPIKLEYNFMSSETDIMSVEIVELGKSEYSWTFPEEQRVICKIENVADFLDMFSKIDCFLNLKIPTKVQDDSTVFKINYGDGAYELIGINGQSRFYYEPMAYLGYRYFDEQKFADLIEFYIENE